MEDYAVNDWGIATFPKKKGMADKITAYGQITGLEKKVLTFQDDCTEYIIERKNFVFEKKPEPVKK